MLQIGLLTPEQYSRAPKKRRMSGSGVAFTLLETSDPAAKDEVQRFEEISYGLHASTGITRMTFRHRMADVDDNSLRLLRKSHPADMRLAVQDRAASTCLTSMEWAQKLWLVYPKTQFEASDMFLRLFRVTLPRGRSYILEPSGTPLQYIRSPFAVSLCPREPLRYPLNQLVAALAKVRFRRLALPEDLSECHINSAYQINQISCVHPEVRALSNKDPRFIFCARSVFDRTPGVDVLRTMNILNLAYFPTGRLIDGVKAAFCSVKPGGLWIVGRTHEQDTMNHVTFFRRTDTSWEILERIGSGSEIEGLVRNVVQTGDSD